MATFHEHVARHRELHASAHLKQCAVVAHAHQGARAPAA